ncbi:MAG: aldehyde dehydrogenase family protein, partial [Candidatus Eremiobacteraeota bacterium]|nr:aldehyde dehydrogenase family protein [Candidatus Eremiobacteraeota bacterium]
MESLDANLALLKMRKQSWARLPVGTKIDYLLAVRSAVGERAAEWAAVCARAKGLDERSAVAGEEWIAGPWAVLYALNRYIRCLRSIGRDGTTGLRASRVRPESGQIVADVFPRTGYDRFLLPGVRAEVWMQPQVAAADLASTTAAFYRDDLPQGCVTLVLGAGNVSSIPALDVLYMLVAEGSACMLKLNPVNAYLGPVLERVFEPFVTAGYLRFAHGGADVGRYLCAHDLVERIHVTGSTQTYEAIVAALPVPKPVSSELGNVSPTIVVPGRWSERDYRIAAESIATQKMHNNGYNCVASQVLVLSKAWPGTPRLLGALGDVFDRTPPRDAYYPGTAQRFATVAGERDDTVTFDPVAEGSVPRALVRADVSNPHEPAFTTEAFCSVLAYVELPGDPATFLHDSVIFANERLHGRLGANLIVHPRTHRRRRAQIDRAIADLEYGCIGVNTWTGVGFFLTETPWGAYRAACGDDPREGSGVVHNAFLFAKSQKSVVYG